MTLLKRVKSIAERLREREPESRLEPWTTEQASKLMAKHSQIPEDYLQYLKLIGSGSIGRSRFMVYGGFLQPKEIYGPDGNLRFPGIVLIGDDFAGDCLGYNTFADWELGWISSSQRWDRDSKNKLFIDFVEDWFLK